MWQIWWWFWCNLYSWRDSKRYQGGDAAKEKSLLCWLCDNLHSRFVLRQYNDAPSMLASGTLVGSKDFACTETISFSLPLLVSSTSNSSQGCAFKAMCNMPAHVECQWTATKKGFQLVNYWTAGFVQRLKARYEFLSAFLLQILGDGNGWKLNFN